MIFKDSDDGYRVISLKNNHYKELTQSKSNIIYKTLLLPDNKGFMVFRKET